MSNCSKRRYFHVALSVILGSLSLLSLVLYFSFLNNRYRTVIECETLMNKVTALYLGRSNGSADSEIKRYNPLLSVLKISQYLDVSHRVNSEFLYEVFWCALVSEKKKIADEYHRKRTVFYILIFTLLTADIICILMVIQKHSLLNNSKKNEDYRDQVHRNMLDILEKDRNLISCELHDDLAQKLAMINQFFSDPQFNSEQLDLLKKYSRESIQQIRLVSQKLRTPVITAGNFREAYEQFFSDYKLLTGINLEFKLIGVSRLIMDDEKNVHVFRIVQELLNNAFKHSQAEKICCSILYSHPEIIVKYSDNGIGYDFESSVSQGLGLNSIQFRMKMLGASWVLRDTVSPGVKLVFKVPV